MKGKLVLDNELRDRLHVFEDRREAGRILTDKLAPYKGSDAIVLAIPAGGVPVAIEISSTLGLPLELVVVRKVQLPWNTEAGFGAVDPDGKVIINNALLNRLGWMNEEEIKLQVDTTLKELQRREKVLRGGKAFPDIGGKSVILVDDGLASGYTMLAAVRFVKNRSPERVVIAVPTGSANTVDMILGEVDELVCLNLRGGFAFAVADAYRKWHDVSEEEVMLALERHAEGGK